MSKKRKFDVEHALGMYASSFVVIPAFAIYDGDLLKQYEKILATCHIYLIGAVPQVDFVGARQEGQQLITLYEVAGEARELEWPIPTGFSLGEGPEGWYLMGADGSRIFPDDQDVIFQRLNNEQNAIGFKVLYIGQAYGKDGSRNALDRLLKHETLQKISLQGLPPGYRLNLLLLEIEPGNRMYTSFHPQAEVKDHGTARISSGLDKLFDTDEVERITLYEASLIRYFQPRYNKEFKNSFPSTNMKVLADCYDKDFSALVAEICIDELPFKLFSDSIAIKQYHTVVHDLHDDESRKMFFI